MYEEAALDHSALVECVPGWMYHDQAAEVAMHRQLQVHPSRVINPVRRLLEQLPACSTAADVSRLAACPGRDSRSLRWAWCAMSGGELVAESGTAMVPFLHPLVCGPIAPVHPLPEELFIKTARSIHSGHPWDYIATRGGDRDAPREMALHQMPLETGGRMEGDREGRYDRYGGVGGEECVIVCAAGV